MDHLAIIVMGLVALGALVLAGFSVVRILGQSKAMTDAVVALKLANGDENTFRRVALQLAGNPEPEEEIEATPEAPAREPLVVQGAKNEEAIIDLMPNGVSIEDALGVGWR